MTSINALKFNNHTGVMVCDEQRGWNDERLRINCSDKIIPVVPEFIGQKYQLSAAYGNTGSSTIGDEIRQTLKKRIQTEYQNELERIGHPPETFLSVLEVAQLTFKIICDIKRDHVDENLKHSFGFTTQELIQGQYEKKGETIVLDNAEILKEAMERIGPPKEATAHNVLNNAGILAGYDAKEGFQIFLFSMRAQYYEPIPVGFACLGSGSDIANVVMADFFNQRTVGERSELESVSALRHLLFAVSTASRTNIGVGGYMNILLFGISQNPYDVLEINDHRSKLALEAVHAFDAGFFKESQINELLEGLFFQSKDFAWGECYFWANAQEPQKLYRFLREYPEEVWKI